MTPWSNERVVSVVLAGGRGTRMKDDTRHKVCFEVGGIPVILRALRSYEQCGIDHHVIVVGTLGEQVLHTVGSCLPNVSFAYQSEPLGTGHAAKCGARMLQDSGFGGLVLVVVGDRLVAPHIVHRLLATLRDTRSDVVFLVGHKDDNPTSGRVLCDSSGNACGIIETSEIALSNLAADLQTLIGDADGAVPAATILERVRDRFPSERKARKACGDLLARATSTDAVPCDELSALLAPLREATTLTVWMDQVACEVSAAEVEDRTDQANLSAYLFRAPALYEALGSLEANNAQGEEYLTDGVKFLASRRHANGTPMYSLRTVCVDHPDDSMGFNTPEELAEIERKVCQEQADQADAAGSNALKPVSEWRRLFADRDPLVLGFMERTYGPAPDLHDEKREEFLAALDQFIKTHGPEMPVFISRSPGRANLMGSHIDHRGGNTNVIAINDEIIMVASPRDDDRVTLTNTCPSQFPNREFSISQDIAHLDWCDWPTCVNSPKTLQLVSGGDWSNYVRAAALRLQQQFRCTPLRGADIVAHGTIPVGSGLSSSSALVVGAAEVLVAVNGLPVPPDVLVDLCAEGEWFVGTRGGASDHAAIKFGRRGAVAHVGFLPFGIAEFLPFLEGYSVVVCDSGVEARKSQGARFTYNKKILGYVTGEIIVKRLVPEAAASIHHFRDITAENLGVDLAGLYGLVKQLPMTITRDALFADYGPFEGPDADKLDALLATLPGDNDEFGVRGVVLYGLAEVDRSKRCVEYLRAQDPVGFGDLWYISHDGDRVVVYDADGNPSPWRREVTDEYLDRLIADLAGGGDRAAHAQLYLQPGDYGCSTPELDLIVDVSKRQEGVVGAQVAGAGLGGCCTILARDDACDGLIAALGEHGFTANRYRSVEGAGIINV